jgi:hypothetical protein
MSEAKPEDANDTCVAGTDEAGKASSCEGCPNQVGVITLDDHARF